MLHQKILFNFHIQGDKVPYGYKQSIFNIYQKTISQSTFLIYFETCDHRTTKLNLLQTFSHFKYKYYIKIIFYSIFIFNEILYHMVTIQSIFIIYKKTISVSTFLIHLGTYDHGTTKVIKNIYMAFTDSKNMFN